MTIVESPYKEIIIGITAILSAILGGGLLTALVNVIKLIAERVDQRKKERKEIENLSKSETAEMKRIEADGQKTAFEHLQGVITVLKDESTDYKEEIKNLKVRIRELEKELEEAENHSSMPKPTITKIYQAMLTLRKSIGAMEIAFERKYGVVEIEAHFIAVKKRFEEVDSLFP